MQNDAGNGDRLLALHEHALRYCLAFKKWLVWDGHDWAVDESDKAQNVAKHTMLEYLRRARDARDDGHSKFARASLEAKRIINTLAIVHYEFRISPKKLDADPWLLNFRNGTADLRTGELREHRREDFITRLVNYDCKHR